MRNLYLLLLLIFLSFYSCSINTDVVAKEVQPPEKTDSSVIADLYPVPITANLSIREWIKKICETEHPEKTVIAYNFGLIEIDNGYTLYLIGSKEFDNNNSDWAFNIDFEPQLKYYPLPDSAFKMLKWDKVQEKITAQLKEFTASTEYRNSFFADAKAITTGFDDGDLVRIK